MDTHTFLTNADTECTIVARRGIRCISHPDGAILIETETESITIHLRKTSHEGVPFTIGDERNNQTPAELNSAGGSLEDVAQEDGDGTRGTQEHTGSHQERDREDVVDTTNEIDQFCEQLAPKILQNWEERSSRWKKGAAELLAGPKTFFDEINSPIQWSFQTLNRSETKVDRFLLPFHKMNLFVWWRSFSIKSTNAVCDIKNALYETVKSDYMTLLPEKKKTIQKQVQRYVAQGEVLWLMYEHTKGLLITVPQFITTNQLTFLGKHKAQLCVSELRWMPKELLEASELYLNIVRDLIETYFPNWPEVSPRKQPQDSDQLALDSGTDLRTEITAVDVFTKEMRGGKQARDAETRQQLDDWSESHGCTIDTLTNSGHRICKGSKRKQPLHHNTVAKRRAISGYEATQLNVVHGYEQDDSTSSPTGRYPLYTRDSGDDQSQGNGNAVSIVSADVLNHLQPEQHNISERPKTLPDERASDTASAGATLMITSSVHAADNQSPGPQPSSQDGPEHSHSSGDLQDISRIHTERMGQQQQTIEDISTLLDTAQVGFNLNSYLPDRDSQSYITAWESTWLGN